MPTLQELEDTIESFSNNQIAEFNLVCDSKIHNTSQGRISQPDLDEAQDTANDVDALSSEDLATLTGNLATNVKLSHRPC